MTPLYYYQQQLETNLIQKDPQQKEAIDQLQHIYTELLAKESDQNHFFGRLLRSFSPSKPIKGLYLWGKGSVGVGNPFLIDIFYHCLPLKKCDCISINLCNAFIMN